MILKNVNEKFGNKKERECYGNIIRNFSNQGDKPKNATSGSAYRFFIGGSSIGQNVDERSAMHMTAVYSCVRILSDAVGEPSTSCVQFLLRGWTGRDYCVVSPDAKPNDGGLG